MAVNGPDALPPVPLSDATAKIYEALNPQIQIH